jgi:hypothetical protein
MSKPRDQAKEQFWRQALADWQHSGLSVTGFCHQRQIQTQSFFRWRRLLCLRDQSPASPVEGPGDSPTAPPLFVPVHVRAAAPVAAPSPAFEVVLRTGRVLRVGQGFDPDNLRRLLVVLEEQPC